jgi:uncharacterized protein (DUF427 family)
VAVEENQAMAKATWNGVTVAESADTVVVENNHYFPIGAMAEGVELKPSPTTTVCPWKGTAHYYTLVAGGAENKDAVWYYPDPKSAAAQIKDRIAFWKGVKVA